MEDKPRNYLYAILIFTLVIAWGVSWLGNLNAMGLGETQELANFEQDFDRLDNVTSRLNEMESTIQGATAEEGDNVLWALMRSGWSTLKMTFSGFGFMTDTLRSSSAFGIPQYVINVGIGFIVVVLVFGAIALIWGRET